MSIVYRKVIGRGKLMLDLPIMQGTRIGVQHELAHRETLSSKSYVIICQTDFGSLAGQKLDHIKQITRPPASVLVAGDETTKETI